MTRYRHSLALAGLLAAGLLSAPVLAASLRDAAAPKADRAEQHRRHAERICADGPARLAGWLGFAETKLQITAAQRGAWDAYARDIRASAAPLQAQCNALPTQAATTPDAKPDPVEHMKRAETMMQAGLDSLKLRREATEKLLPQLTPEQRDAFAQLPPMRQGPGGPGMGPHRIRHHQ